MKLYYLLIILSVGFISCSSSKKLPTTLGDPKNAEAFGYQPIDPLPVYYRLEDESGEKAIVDDKSKISNKRIMASLPDETMRLAIGQIDRNGNINFASAKLGYKGSSYIVILDYVKFDTKSLPVNVIKDSLTNKYISFKTFDYTGYKTSPDAIIPVYIGVGLRFTASITVNEGTVDLGNLFALGIAAESKKVTGTLIIQTLGISGKDISALIPMPSQINTTTIQNAIMSLASIKAKIYEEEAEINPRVVGFYNNLGGGQETVNKFISSILSVGIKHIIK